LFNCAITEIGLKLLCQKLGPQLDEFSFSMSDNSTNKTAVNKLLNYVLEYTNIKHLSMKKIVPVVLSAYEVAESLLMFAEKERHLSITLNSLYKVELTKLLKDIKIHLKKKVNKFIKIIYVYVY
jgi:hypothetical protein